MKNVLLTLPSILLQLFCIVGFNKASAQNCVLKPPVIKVDFGSTGSGSESGLSFIKNYRRDYGDCPRDGNYSLLSYSTQCFSDHWITLEEDHTPGDVEGKMLLMNASYTPGLFFIAGLEGLLPNTTYELGTWLVNVCKPGFTCSGLKPHLRFVVENTSGAVLAKFSTGEIMPTGTASWLHYTAMFTTPASVGRLVLKIETKTEGGCGNDFAMDDITFRECVLRKTKPTARSQPSQKPATKTSLTAANPGAKNRVILPKPVKKDPPVPAKLAVSDLPVKTTVAKPRAALAPAPRLVLTRENPVVKRIETSTGELQVDLYDNGDIDGDTVTIYHNNTLIVSRAALTASPISFRIPVNVNQPHHELIMVANNLGSIPPNTSLMVVTARDKRYEVFISSTQQKNARVVIDLKD